MAKASTNEFRSGLRIILDGIPYTIMENEMVKPGKGQAFNRVKVRNLKNNKVIEKTFKSGEMVELADVVEIVATYLYSDDQFSYFMDTNSFEQITATIQVASEVIQWVKAEQECTLVIWNGEPIQAIPPNTNTLLVTHTEPGVKGDSTGTVTKPATLETGAAIKVPLFISEGELVLVDTRTKAYLSRKKA